ncbi:hypothetical protein V8E55_008887 [Tylopilus felleus]
MRRTERYVFPARAIALSWFNVNIMKGHEFLTSFGILHRDISENNIVLGVYPWEERGYLIDFDMTILQDAEEPTQAPSTQSDNQPPHPTGESSTKTPQGDQTKHMKGVRTVGILITLVSGRFMTSSEGYLPLHFVQRTLGLQTHPI